jgi:hypothetical protein
LTDKLGGGAENPGNEEDEAKAAEVALVVALAPITEDCCCCGRDVPDGLELFTLKDSLAPFGVFPFMLLLPLRPNPNAVPGAIADAVRDGNDPSDVAAAAAAATVVVASCVFEGDKTDARFDVLFSTLFSNFSYCT